MRVLMLCWELPPDNSGGLGVACYQLCKALSRKDVDIEFVLPFKHSAKVDFMKVSSAGLGEEYIQSWLAMGAYDSFAYGEAWNHGGHVIQTAYEKAVTSIAKSGQFDVLHAHDWLTFRAALKAKQATGLPLIVHVHSVESDRAGGNPGNPIVREIEALGMMMADKIIAVSERTKKAIADEYFIPMDKISVVHNSVDIEEMEPLDAQNAYHYLEVMKSRGYKVVASVSRLTMQKGLTGLLHVAREVVARAPKTLFLIVGDGDQMHELIGLAADLGIARNVIFTGFQRGKNWRDSFAVADLFVMPSVSEPFGITPLEAINYGTPSLVSRQSGITEVFKNCLMVDFWDSLEMANQIASALESPNLLSELTVNASKELTKHNWGLAAEKTIGVYNTHLDGALV